MALGHDRCPWNLGVRAAECSVRRRAASPIISTWRSTADRSNESDTYCSNVFPPTNDCTSRAAMSISCSHAGSRAGSSPGRLRRSGGIYDLIAAHDRVAAKWILNLTLFDDVHGPCKYGLQVGIYLGGILECEPMAEFEL